MTESTAIFRSSPFLDPSPTAAAGSLAILHLKRDLLLPVTLEPSSFAEGYAEGAVINTRFGSFPHSTLLNLPWGSQVLASKVDTGSRGRRGDGKGRGKKRKREELGSETVTPQEGANVDAGEEPREARAATAAGSGFIHLLPPTPEAWTLSLPHRTQVVYTPDYSYILQRLRVRPGDTVIEAGAGSGSFTHAAARAVFNGYPPSESGQSNSEAPNKKRKRYGKVYSFEYHEPRAQQLAEEIKQHGLDQIVRVTHRDVYEDGFTVDTPTQGYPQKEHAPQANAVFLDLPAPWMALRQLTRAALSPQAARAVTRPRPASDSPGQDGQADTTMADAPQPTTSKPFVSPLDPRTTTHLCTFSPCIEQVQRTVTAMRELGWLEIDMVEVQHRRIDVRRERVGLHEEGLRGVNASAASVDEAVSRLREVESRLKEFRENTAASAQGVNDAEGGREVDGGRKGMGKPQKEWPPKKSGAKQQRQQANVKAAEERKIFKEGRLVHRTEPELKTHTSYLAFAVLPRQWTAEDEARCKRRWPVKDGKQAVENGNEKKM
ncbi:hypothetical protein B0A49_09223 [Cryomyces minteri]|uniref:tRNA (adenine(58)-N(1))-methyltransferase catalytic subunit TRM61 n=1 Tax=Cryomyces minteri TaxID=331657 RepID=A0A4U0X6I6_9PEZI|nr:hypothetical protein B0A49_09223 [Cryomyces minteri]